MRRRCLIILLASMMMGCAGMSIDNWQLHYKNCKVHEYHDNGAITCKWKHSWLGT